MGNEKPDPPKAYQQQLGATAAAANAGRGNEQENVASFISNNAQQLIAANGSVPAALLAASLAQGMQAESMPTGAAPSSSTIPAGLNALLAVSQAPAIAASPALQQLQAHYAQQQQQQHPFLNASMMLGGLKGSLLQHRPNKLRSGKWIREEEEYALVLIELFEKGMVADCENGTTMRAYLSRKLQCPPMRISKKFAGKGIGKMIYVRQELCPDNALESKRVAAEQKFYQAIYSMSDYLSVSKFNASGDDVARTLRPSSRYAQLTFHSWLVLYSRARSGAPHQLKPSSGEE